MDALECHPDFNPDVKIKDIDSAKTENNPKTNGQDSIVIEANGAEEMKSHDEAMSHDTSAKINDTSAKIHDTSAKMQDTSCETSCDQEEEEDLGLSMFQEAPESVEMKKGNYAFFSYNTLSHIQLSAADDFTVSII